MPQFPVCGNFWPVWLIELTYECNFFHLGLYITLCSKRRMNMPCIYACCIQYKSIYAPLPQSQQKIHWLVIFPQDSYHMYIYLLTYLCTCIWLEDPFYDVFRFFFYLTWCPVFHLLLQVIFEIIFIFSLWIPLHLYVVLLIICMYVVVPACMPVTIIYIYTYLVYTGNQRSTFLIEFVLFFPQ